MFNSHILFQVFKLPRCVGQLPAEILKKVRRVELKTRRLVNESMAGEYHSVFKGRGIEFDEVRPYQEGDDVYRSKMRRFYAADDPSGRFSNDHVCFIDGQAHLLTDLFLEDVI